MACLRRTEIVRENKGQIVVKQDADKVLPTGELEVYGDAHMG